MNQVLKAGNLHELGNVRFSRWRSERNLHRLNNFNSFECQSARNLHRLNNFNSFNFFPGLLVRRHSILKKKKIEIMEPVQVSCTLTLKRIEIIEAVQVSCISPLRNLNTSKCLLTRSPRKKMKNEIIEPVQVSYT